MNKFLVVLAVLVAGPVFADIPPSDTAGCASAEEGTACKTDQGVPGSCVTSTCSRNDYSEGPPPKVKTYECKKCVSSAPAPAPVAEKPAPVVETKKKSGCSAVPAETLIGLALVLARRKYRG